jgi:hypothetical protein
MTTFSPETPFWLINRPFSAVSAATGIYLLRNGGQISPTNYDMFRYVSDWQVQPTEPQLFRTPGASSCTRPSSGRGWFSLAQAKNMCTRWGNVPGAKVEMCAWDVYLTGDPNTVNMYTKV